MFVAKKQDATLEAHSGALYPDLATGTSWQRNHVKTTQKLSFGPKEEDWACSL